MMQHYMAFAMMVERRSHSKIEFETVTRDESCC